MPTHFSKISVVQGLKHGAELESALASLHRNEAGSVAKGRNVTAGYTRGWGLEYANLGQSIAEDPIFKESFALAKGRSLVSEHKLMNIFMIMKYGMTGIDGDIIEFGSYRGGSAVFMANAARRLGMPSRVYALDTFAGMPKTDEVLDLHYAGNFNDTSVDELRTFTQQHDLPNLIAVQGLFSDTAPSVLAKVDCISLAHIDCDIHDAVKYSIEIVQEKMNARGGYVVFDDPLHGSCIGALEAVEDLIQTGLRAEQAYPHLVYRFPKL